MNLFYSNSISLRLSAGLEAPNKEINNVVLTYRGVFTYGLAIIERDE